jgi:hypothetical protein
MNFRLTSLFRKGYDLRFRSSPYDRHFLAAGLAEPKTLIEEFEGPVLAGLNLWGWREMKELPLV